MDPAAPARVHGGFVPYLPPTKAGVLNGVGACSASKAPRNGRSASISSTSTIGTMFSFGSMGPSSPSTSISSHDESPTFALSRASSSGGSCGGQTLNYQPQCFDIRSQRSTESSELQSESGTSVSDFDILGRKKCALCVLC